MWPKALLGFEPEDMIKKADIELFFSVRPSSDYSVTSDLVNFFSSRLSVVGVEAL